MRTTSRRLWVLGLTTALVAFAAATRQPNANQPAADASASIGVEYLEIVTPSVDETCELLGATHGVAFSEPIAGLGHARVADLRGGGRIGVRAPMGEHETPVVRPYLLVDDIEAAFAAAQAAGGEVAVPPMEIEGEGTFAIYVLGGIQQGLWER